MERARGPPGAAGRLRVLVTASGTCSGAAGLPHPRKGHSGAAPNGLAEARSGYVYSGLQMRVQNVKMTLNAGKRHSRGCENGGDR